MGRPLKLCELRRRQSSLTRRNCLQITKDTGGKTFEGEKLFGRKFGNYDRRFHHVEWNDSRKVTQCMERFTKYRAICGLVSANWTGTQSAQAQMADM